MTPYQIFAEKPTQFLSLTGYTRQEFDELLPYFNECFYERMKTHCIDGKLRSNRPYVDYRNSPLPTIEEKLFFILIYLKTNNLQSVQGALFNISQPKANLWIHCLHTVLNQALEHLNVLPARYIEDVDFEDATGVLCFQDGTERPIPRPTNNEMQRAYYSGKKTAYSQEQHLEQ